MPVRPCRRPPDAGSSGYAAPGAREDWRYFGRPSPPLRGCPRAEVCPVNAIEHDGDRIHVKEQECIGCRLCAHRVPLRAIHPDGTSIAGVAGMRPDASYPKSLSSLLTWAPGQYTPAVKCDLCAFDPTARIVAVRPHQGADRRGGAADREPDEAKRLRSIEKTVRSSTLPLWPRACPRKQKGA